MLKVTSKISFANIERLLKHKKKDPTPILQHYGQAGVDALRAATPIDTGLTAASWYYTISQDKGVWRLSWCNSNIQNGIQIAILVQMGHASRNGSWVQGVDYINPALKDLFKQFQIKIGKELLG